MQKVLASILVMNKHSAAGQSGNKTAQKPSNAAANINYKNYAMLSMV